MVSESEENEEEKSEDVQEDAEPRFGPEAKDTIEKSKQQEEPLREKDFIRDDVRVNPSPLLVWLLTLAVFMAMFWGGRSWYLETIGEKIAADPFLQVTNRDFSLFLWQNPEFMRTNWKTNKAGYLPAFQYLGDVSLDPALADKYIVAPPEVIFRYHTWNRLVKDAYSPTPISVDEFREFLADAPEWNPNNWPGALAGYSAFIKSLPMEGSRDLQSEPESRLPNVVRLAFQGWKNYYKQGDAIESVSPAYAELQRFLVLHPHYARNYWRNVLDKSVPSYLKTLASGNFRPSQTVPKDELAPFLKAAFFNYTETKP